MGKIFYTHKKFTFLNWHTERECGGDLLGNHRTKSWGTRFQNVRL